MMIFMPRQMALKGTLEMMIAATPTATSTAQPGQASATSRAVI